MTRIRPEMMDCHQAFKFGELVDMCIWDPRGEESRVIGGRKFRTEISLPKPSHRTSLANKILSRMFDE